MDMEKKKTWPIFKVLSQYFVQKLKKTSFSKADIRAESDLALPINNRRGNTLKTTASSSFIVTLIFIVYVIKLETVFTIIYW
jgi:hypothetical protein